jgi:hypothetical protein
MHPPSAARRTARVAAVGMLPIADYFLYGFVGVLCGAGGGHCSREEHRWMNTFLEAGLLLWVLHALLHATSIQRARVLRLSG